MSLHSSFKGEGTRSVEKKTVLSRLEKIKTLVEKGSSLEKISVFGLPKIKVVRMKITKKTAKEEGEKEEKESKEEGKSKES